MSERQININIAFLLKCLEENKRGVVLEGSSRSGKSISCVDFIIGLCSKNKGLVINIIKETYASFKTTLYDDFSNRLNAFGISNPFGITKDIQTYELFGNKINFMGADQDSKFHGASCDYFWINEALDINQKIFDQLEMRCRKMWFIDYNPKYSIHWVYNKICNRSDVGFIKTTFKDNPFLSEGERNKILSYEPTALNIKEGTADDYMWQVYGLGMRTAQTGLIFKNINWIDSWPEHIKSFSFGLDFGFINDPTALVKVAIEGNNIYIKGLCYEPIDNSLMLSEYLHSLESEGLTQGSMIVADCADRYNDVSMIKELRDLGHYIKKANKAKGVVWSIGLLKKYKINIVHDINFKREAENYKWREINGITINEPVDAYNHYFDAVRYITIELQTKAPAIKW